MELSARLRLPSLLAVAGLAGLLASATALGGATGPAPAARSFVNGIFQRNGAVVCRLADPTTKAELLALSRRARNDPTWQGPSDCAHMAKFLIGYPHQNVGLQFVAGRILSVGRVREVSVGRHVYRGVQLRVRLKLERTAYPTQYQGSLTPVVKDVVWLAKTAHGWRSAKPPLSLLLAGNGDILASPGEMRAALAPPRS